MTCSSVCYTLTKTYQWLKSIIRVHELPEITPHHFRHTHASLLFESGATLKDVQYRFGHSDIQTTMDIYTHVTKQAKEQLAERFNEYIDF